MVSKTALAIPPRLEDYPAASRVTTICFLVLMFAGWVAAWISQLLFTYTIGWFLSEGRLVYWNGWLFRIFSAGPTSKFVPGIRVKVTSAWTIPREVIKGRKSVMICANHRSFMDPFALAGAMLPLETKYVAKADLLKIPFGGWAMGRAGDMAVHFDPKSKAGWGTVKGTVGLLLEQASKHFVNGNSVAIFPEGTRMGYDAAKAKEASEHPSKLAPFKAPFFDLAKKHGIPVVCVALQGADDVWPVGSNALRSATVHVDIAKPLNPDDYETGMEYAEAARNKIGKMYLALCSANAGEKED